MLCFCFASLSPDLICCSTLLSGWRRKQELRLILAHNIQGLLINLECLVKLVLSIAVANKPASTEDFFSSFSLKASTYKYFVVILFTRKPRHWMSSSSKRFFQLSGKKVAGYWFNTELPEHNCVQLFTRANKWEKKYFRNNI